MSLIILIIQGCVSFCQHVVGLIFAAQSASLSHLSLAASSVVGRGSEALAFTRDSWRVSVNFSEIRGLRVWGGPNCPSSGVERLSRF